MLRLHGIHVKHNKNTAGMTPCKMPIPKTLVFPMSMHIGAPAKPCVAVGDEVKVGQKIAEAGGFVSSPIYTGVSGKVKKIDTITASNGAKVESIVIESDGLQTLSEGITPPVIETREDFIAALRESGVVGLGGAGFPTAVKLNVDPEKVDFLIVNGAECEPFITSDTRTMIDNADRIVRGLLTIRKYIGAKKIIIGIEKNKPECISVMTKAILGNEEFMSVKTLPSIYPQGGEKVLAFHAAGRVIGEGKLPIDAGVVIMNCTTVDAIERYLETGMPLVNKCVTVDGSAVKEPKNVIVPIGTQIRDIFEFCGGFSEEPKMILSGGPMMGITLTDLSSPIMKQTNAVLAFGKKEANVPEPSACIRCGRCAAACPFGLMPVAIEKAMRENNGEALEKLKVNLCMECGSCSYVCPAKRQIVQQNKLAKEKLRNYQNAKKAKENKEGGSK